MHTQRNYEKWKANVGHNDWKEIAPEICGWWGERKRVSVRERKSTIESERGRERKKKGKKEKWKQIIQWLKAILHGGMWNCFEIASRLHWSCNNMFDVSHRLNWKPKSLKMIKERKKKRKKEWKKVKKMTKWWWFCHGNDNDEGTNEKYGINNSKTMMSLLTQTCKMISN